MRNAPLIVTSLIALAVGVVLFTRFVDSPAPAAAGNNPMEAMSVDMDPTTNPANTETSIGTIQDCARINEDDILNADEEVVEDSLEIDVTALNIPKSSAMVAFSYTLLIRNAGDTQTVADRISIDMAGMTDDAYADFFLLGATAGSNIFNTNDAMPDQDGVWTGSSLDIGPPTAAESGSGVLERMLISSVPGAPEGQYRLKLTSAFHTDVGGPPANLPGTLNHGRVAIDTACADIPTPTPTAGPPTDTPTPTPTGQTPDPTETATPTPTGPTPTLCVGKECPTETPTPTPTPTPTAGPKLTQGDLDCDKDVDSVDALFALRDVAGLPVNQPPDCPEIGGVLARGISGQGGGAIFGDVDCDGDVDSVDALKILRHVAGLSVVQTEPCPDIGDPI